MRRYHESEIAYYSEKRSYTQLYTYIIQHNITITARLGTIGFVSTQ